MRLLQLISEHDGMQVLIKSLFDFLWVNIKKIVTDQYLTLLCYAEISR